MLLVPVVAFLAAAGSGRRAVRLLGGALGAAAGVAAPFLLLAPRP